MTGALPTTEQGKHTWLHQGKPLHFPKRLKKRARTIRAAWLEELAEGPERVVRVPIDVANAIIVGRLDLSYATFKAHVMLLGCRFTDLADFSFARFEKRAQFERSYFVGPATFLGVHIGGDADFVGAQFEQPAAFDGARIEGGAFFRPAEDAQGKPCPVVFKGAAHFLGVHIGGQADFAGAQFKKEAAFDGARIEGGAFFRPAVDAQGNPVLDAQGKPYPVVFKGPARFPGVHIGGQADFAGAQFEQEAAFDGAQVDGGAFFRPAVDAEGNPVLDAQGKPCPVVFKGAAHFLGVHIGGQAGFAGAQFEKEAAFDRARIEGGAFFRPAVDAQGKPYPVVFKGAARFHGVHIGGVADFAGAQFEQRAAFDGARIEGVAFFRPAEDAQGKAVLDAQGKPYPVRFRGEAHFPAVVFLSEAQFKLAKFYNQTYFENARFAGGADFGGMRCMEQAKADFTGARFERGANFTRSCFGAEATFDCVQADREADFTGATFSGQLSLRDAHFRVLRFRKGFTQKPEGQSQQFRRALNLVGCTYRRIEVAWEELLDGLESYHRQPYFQLEAVARAMGEDHQADEIYFARRLREWRELWRNVPAPWSRPSGFRELVGSLGRALLDTLEWLVVGYAVRRLRLLLWIGLVLALGAWVFARPGAVELAPEEMQRAAAEASLRAPQGVQAAPAALPDAPARLSCGEAIGVSFYQFLPVDVASGKRWRPSRNELFRVGGLGFRFSAYATLHRIAGLLLVAAAIFAFTGLRRRIGYRPAAPAASAEE